MMEDQNLENWSSSIVNQTIANYLSDSKKPQNYSGKEVKSYLIPEGDAHTFSATWRPIMHETN